MIAAPRRLHLEHLHLEGGLGVCTELLHAQSKAPAGVELIFDSLQVISLSASELEVLKAEVAQLRQNRGVVFLSLGPRKFQEVDSRCALMKPLQ
jgi:hypothetical protein